MPLPNAPAAAPPSAPPVLPPVAEDHRFSRVPMVRHAMILLVPHKGGGNNRIEITELTAGGRVSIQEAGSSFDKSVDLNVRELRELSDFCNRIARRVAVRPDYRP